MSSVNESPAWAALESHFEATKDRHMRDLFAEDPQRFERFSSTLGDLLFDYSKNRMSSETLSLLMDLARQCKVEEWRDRMLAGEMINHTEQRAVQHMALRADTSKPLYALGQDVSGEIAEELDKVKTLAEMIRAGDWLGATGKPITDVINIGVGGSDLGPQMVVESLTPYVGSKVNVHFVSNLDENHILNVLKEVKQETSLFIVSSKSFTTQETMINAETARNWLLAALGDEKHLPRHLVAVSSNVSAAVKFGVAEENIFKMWDWVGGRFSLWSAIGLSIVVAIGADNFDQLLAGARMADEHFIHTPLEDNIPVIMAMLGVWYNNFHGCESIAIFPYDQNMERFPTYLRQADMESNGKSVDREGNPINYQTGPIMFGGLGIPSQHAFYQLLHQGTKIVPADFIAAITDFECLAAHHRGLMSNIFAQTEAMMLGKTEEEAMADMLGAGMSQEDAEALLPYKVFPGNRPTNTFLYRTLDPKTLGTLIALYEHKIFVQGVIWNINSYDQWGVELGKVLAKSILEEIDAGEVSKPHDSSTVGLLNHYFKLRPKNS